MKKPITDCWLLTAILVLAAVLRFYGLAEYPALNADEAAIGYNAYSLIQTGKDEHGNPWPIHFQSFNDYKPGLYFYLVLPFIKILGLNEWAVRLPGATLGVLTVFVVYFLVKELFPGRQEFKIGEIAAFMLAISPWHLHFSRGGWEANAATFFIVLGVYLFLKFVGSKNWWHLAFSICNLALAMYTYHAARIVVPLLVLGLSGIYLQEIRGKLKEFMVAVVVGMALLAPLASDLLGPAGISRATGVGLFADTGPLSRINEQRGEHEDLSSSPAKILHNKAVNYGLAFAQNWAAHFHGEFLFLSGDAIQRNKVPETGQLYLFEIMTLLVGTVAMAKAKWSNGSKLIFWWLAVAPIAAALTFQSPHALRAHNLVIPLGIISAYGTFRIFDWLKKFSGGESIPPGRWKTIATFGYLSFAILILWSFIRYQHLYWVHLVKEYPYSSQYGVKELVAYIFENQKKYEKIWITDRYDQPYILFLFYLKYPPLKFQKEHTLSPRDKFGFSTVRDFDKFHFGSVNFDKIRPENPNSLIIGTDAEIPREANIVKKIYGTNGHLYFEVVAN